MLDLVVRICGGDRQDALRWLAEFSGVPLADQPLSLAERARWAAERRELELYLTRARCWQTAAIALGEDLLDELKRGLFNPTEMQPAVGETAEWTARLAWWRPQRSSFTEP